MATYLGDCSAAWQWVSRVEGLSLSKSPTPDFLRIDQLGEFSRAILLELELVEHRSFRVATRHTILLSALLCSTASASCLLAPLIITSYLIIMQTPIHFKSAI